MKLLRASGWYTNWRQLATTRDNPRRNLLRFIRTRNRFQSDCHLHTCVPLVHMCPPLTCWHLCTLLSPSLVLHNDWLWKPRVLSTRTDVHVLWLTWFLRPSTSPPALVRMGCVPVSGTLTREFVNATSLPAHDLGPYAIDGPCAGAHALGSSAWVQHCGI